MNRPTQIAIDKCQEQLRADGIPHAVATVVRTLSSTAAKPGMKAIVLESGEFAEGWLGGGCVTSAVRRAAQTAIETGEATLVCLRPEELLADESDGVMVTLARNGCPSKGSMDIFVEPVVPLPELIVYGHGPVAVALSRIARGFGFTLTVCGDVDRDLVDADFHFTSPADMRSNPPSNADRYIVVATQGAGDIAALTSALAGSAAYAAFVGSRRKFASYGPKLLAAGVSQSRLDAVRSPAGVHINAVTPEEIALSIMAEIVQNRRAQGRTEPGHD
ncbi:MAG TPA: XdhC /CoxI family-like protein [Alphaproteobacteria bacterium]|nr:XdhC /CoxI family-like protein [Alphaproteobacteria bacterium]